MIPREEDVNKKEEYHLKPKLLALDEEAKGSCKVRLSFKH
jgi:hypothetical protein